MRLPAARGLPPRDALLLLPELGGPVAVLGSPGSWPAALSGWGLQLTGSAARTAVVTAGPRAAARSGADVLLVPGADRTAALRRAGYDVTRWWSLPTAEGGAVAGLGRPPRRWQRTAGVSRRESARGAATLTVAARGRSAPAALVAALGTPAPSRAVLRLGSDPRRRAVLYAEGSSGALVVKVSRSPGERARARDEQEVLHRLREAGLRTGLPRPLGWGEAGPAAWSAESLAAGEPLLSVCDRGPATAATALTRLAGLLGELAAATRTATVEGVEDLPLRGEAETERGRLRGLAVPGVMAHGDLASGLNVLVDADGALTVLDWETARRAAPPLLDLLPVLCLGLARGQGAREPQDQCAAVLELARGDHPASPLLHRLVREHAAGLDLPAATLGPLALVAWAYQASMRAVHDELLVTAGLPVPAWTSPSELVLPAWRADPRLGPSWRAVA